jgi:aminoglycoside phosphotransferase (APT) family kinase protein
VLLKSAHAVDREFRVQKALAATDVPVARMHVLCEDDDVIGSAFYIMDLVEGRNFDDPRIQDVDTTTRSAIYDEMNRVLAAIHSVDLEAAGLVDYGPAGTTTAARSIAGPNSTGRAKPETIADMDELIAWLDQNIPEEDGRRTLVHGDYRIDNMLFAKDSPECVAVLDWELSTSAIRLLISQPLIMQWRLPAGSRRPGSCRC